MVNIGRGSHLRFMLASFAIKQSEHAKSRLKLGSSPDTMLIARTMIEGLSQMLWAAKRPRQRPLLWRTFVFVHDWRMIQEHRGKGDSIDPQVERAVRIGLLRFGHRYLTRQARDARAAGRALPTDPYMRNWYDERESEILRDAVRISCGTHTARFRSGTIGASGGLAASCHLTTRRGVLRCRLTSVRCRHSHRLRIPVSLANDATVERTLPSRMGRELQASYIFN